MHPRCVRLLIICCALWLGLGTAHAQQTLYAATDNVFDGSLGGNLYSVDLGTGNTNVVGPILINGDPSKPIGITGLAFNPLTGVLYGVTDPGTSAPYNNCLVTINPATAAATLIGCFGSSIPSGFLLTDITFSNTGTLYGWIAQYSYPMSNLPNSFVSLNLTNGSINVINASETGMGLTYTCVGGLATNPAGTLYVVNNTCSYPETAALGTVNPTTGLVNYYGPTTAGEDRIFDAAAFDEFGVLFATSYDSDLGSDIEVIDTTTGDTLEVAFFSSSTFGEILDAIAFTPAPPALLTHYFSNLNVGDSYINLTNDGSSGGNICVNVYAFDPAEELVSCCACLVTPNALASLSVRTDLLSNTLTAGTPTSLVVELMASGPPVSNGACDAAAPTGVNTATQAWGTTIHATPQGTYHDTETPFSPATLSAAQLARLTGVCGFAESNGSGYGICKSCQAGGLGAAKQ